MNNIIFDRGNRTLMPRCHNHEGCDDKLPHKGLAPPAEVVNSARDIIEKNNLMVPGQAVGLGFS